MGSLVAVWGLCDGTEILFDETSEDVWETTCPQELARDANSDFEDGEYVVEVWGRTRTDFIIYTTAILYLCDSRFVSLRFIDTDYLTRFRAERYEIRRRPDRFAFRTSDLIISVREKNRMEVTIRAYDRS